MHDVVHRVEHGVEVITERTRPIDPSQLGLQADQISLAAVLDLLARQGQATEAAELVEADEISESGVM